MPEPEVLVEDGQQEDRQVDGFLLHELACVGSVEAPKSVPPTRDPFATRLSRVPGESDRFTDPPRSPKRPNHRGRNCKKLAYNGKPWYYEDGHCDQDFDNMLIQLARHCPTEAILAGVTRVPSLHQPRLLRAHQLIHIAAPLDFAGDGRANEDV